MQTFFEWLSSITLSDFDKYLHSLTNYVRELHNYHNDNVEKVKNLNLQQETSNLQIKLQSFKYPRTTELIRSMKYIGTAVFDHEVEQYYKWYRGLPNSFDNKDLRKVLTFLWDLNYLKSNKSEEKEIQDDIKSIYAKTIENANKLKELIEKSNVEIKTRLLIRPSYSETNLEPLTAFEVVFAVPSAPYFQVLLHDKLEIDDILDADEDEFLSNNEVKSEYFALIKELQNPGSSQTGKALTLYTARPSKDRHLYDNATTIPPNIYLTSKYDSALGLATDLHGERDVWRVRIDSRYLMKTVDTRSEQQYQVIGTKPVPVKALTLLTPNVGG